MDDLMREILAILRANPDKKFTHSDLEYLQSPSDIKFAMIHLYEGNYPVYGEIEGFENGAITSMKWITYVGE